MGEQATALTVVVAGTIVLVCRHNWITITDGVRDKVYTLIKGILTLYLLDIFLLIGFGFPFPCLHEGTPAGIAVFYQKLTGFFPSLHRPFRHRDADAAFFRRGFFSRLSRKSLPCMLRRLLCQDDDSVVFCDPFGKAV